MDGTLAKTNLGIVPPKSRTETGSPDSKQQSSTTHAGSDWKVVNQVRAIKQHIGLGTVVSVVSLLLTLLTIAFLIGSPIVSQAGKNEASATSLDNLKAAVKENKEEQQKAIAASAQQQSKELADALAEIKVMVKQSLDQGQQSLFESRSLRASTEAAFVELRQDTKGLWKWSTAIDGRVGILEAEIKQRLKER